METKDNYAKFRISDRELEISGPAEFVAMQLQDNKSIVNFFADALKQNLLSSHTQLEAKSKLLDTSPGSLGEEKKETSDYVDFEVVNDQESLINKYSDVIAVDGDKIQVLGKIQGGSMGSRMVNLILIYLLIKQKIAKVDKVSFSELRNFCELHGELDAAHFADYIKKNKKFFLIDGGGKSAFAKITVPGMKEAEQLLSTMK